MQISAEECKRFLIKDCMSDEENDMIDPNSGDAKSFKVIVPEWRSDKVNIHNQKKIRIYKRKKKTDLYNQNLKLNELYTLLDELHASRSTHFQMSKKRTYHSAPMDVPAKVIKKRLPGWGFRQC